MAYNTLILDLIDECNNYNYITDVHTNTHINKDLLEKCKKIKEQQFAYYPLIRENVGDRMYAYKTNQPRIELFDIELFDIELFDSDIKNTYTYNKILYVILIIIVLLIYWNYKL